MAFSKTQLDHFERRLQEERDAALALLNRSVDADAEQSAEDQAGDLSSMPTHQADLGTDTMQQELDASNDTRISRELAEIDAALMRLHDHPETFGVCEATGKDIPVERLEIIPWARTCGDSAA